MKIHGERPASPAYPMTEQDASGNRTGNHEAPITLDTRRMRTEWSEYERTTKDWVTIEFLGRSPVKTIKRLVDPSSAAAPTQHVLPQRLDCWVLQLSRHPRRYRPLTYDA